MEEPTTQPQLSDEVISNTSSPIASDPKEEKRKAKEGNAI